MRSLVIDFDLTVLLPLILIAAGVLWNSFRAYLESRSEYKASLKRIEVPFDTREEEDAFLEWGITKCEDWRKDGKFLWFVSIAFIALCGLMLTPDGFKASVAEAFWSLFWCVNLVAFVASIPVAWHYAKESEWWKFGICLLVALMLAASVEHVLHQKMNAHHVNCPHCSDDDDDQSDDN